MANVEVVLKGLSEVQKLLAGYNPKTLDKRQQKALMVAGRKLVPYIRAEAPKGKTGKLRAAVNARQGKRDKPSVVVGPRGGKKGRIAGAYYRHMVIGGHRIVAPGHGPGEGRTTTRAGRASLRQLGFVPGNPFVDRGVSLGLEDAIAAYKKALFEEDR
jgi:hypothetical protein